MKQKRKWQKKLRVQSKYRDKIACFSYYIYKIKYWRKEILKMIRQIAQRIIVNAGTAINEMASF